MQVISLTREENKKLLEVILDQITALGKQYYLQN